MNFPMKVLTKDDVTSRDCSRGLSPFVKIYVYFGRLSDPPNVLINSALQSRLTLLPMLCIVLL